MSRRSKKNYNQNFAPQNPFPGSSWQSTSTAPLHNPWDVGDAFWGGNYSNSNNQRRKGNEQWRSGDRDRNRTVQPQKSSMPKKDLYPWSTKNNQENASTSTSQPNDTTSSTNNKEQSPPPNDKFITSKDMKNMRREQTKNLKEGLSKPVECSIAEKMMQKMGWQGGGLGVKEEGRTEPVEVNLKFINKTTGLGHNEKEKAQWSRLQKQKKNSELQKLMANPLMSALPIIPVLYLQPVTLDAIDSQIKPNEKKHNNKKIKKNLSKNKIKGNKKNVHINIDHCILDTILDFVMDVKQTEYAFDLNYTRQERRIIHNFVQYVREGLNEEVYFDFDELHLEKIEEINEYNTYVLVTESQGVHPERQLYMYKEAPDEVYLVTRDDLIEYVEKDVVKNNSEINKTDAVNKNTAKKVNKTPHLSEATNANVGVSKQKADFDIQSTESNSIVHSMITELIANIPDDSQMVIDSEKTSDLIANAYTQDIKTEQKAELDEKSTELIHNIPDDSLMVIDTNKAQHLIDEANAKYVNTGQNIDLDEQSTITDNNSIVRSMITEIIENIPEDSQMVIDSNKTPDSITIANTQDVETDNNSIVHSILTEVIENIPDESQMVIDIHSKSDNEHKKEKNSKNKHTVANFIENCSKKRKSEVLTHNLDVNEANLLKNILNTSENHPTETLQESELDIKLTNSNIASEIKDEEIIEIDLTESEDLIRIVPKTTPQKPKMQPKNLKTPETKNETENDMDAELNRIKGLPKLEHFEKALYIYLKDFLKHDVYTEMRFLGDFGDDEDDEYLLLSKLLSNICAVSDRSMHFDCYETVDVYKELYNNESFYLQLEADINGGDVIYKIPRQQTGED